MELVKRYWWAIAGALVLLLLLRSRSAPSGPSVVQIGGGDPAAIAAIQSQEGLAMDSARIGLINSFLNYTLETDRIDRADDIERLRLESSERVAIRQAEATERAAQYGQSTATTQANLQYQLQLAALQAQRDAQNAAQPDWWQYLLGGVGQYGGLLIDIFDGDNPGFGGGGFGGGGFGGGLDDWIIGGGFGGGTYRDQYPYPPGVIDVGGSGSVGSALGDILGGLF
jgi:hypothetical protein